MKPFVFIAFLIVGTMRISLAQEAGWSFELHGGIPYNIPAPLLIKQQHEASLRFQAHFYSEPMTLPLYWVYRMSRSKNHRAWEFECIHHKLYLDHRPPEVHQLSLSHGYNILNVNRLFHRHVEQKYSYIIRLGAGLVLSHPESEIRDKEFNQREGFLNLGYYFTGPVLNISLGKRFYLSDRLYLDTDCKFNPSLSWVPIVDGYARVWNLPLAFIFGMGFDVGIPKK